MPEEIFQLKQLQVDEVSLVDKPAINRTLLVLKRDSSIGNTGDMPATITVKAEKKTEDGEEFPAGAYLVVPDRDQPSTWKLRIWESPDKKVTRAQLGRTLAALSPGGFRGQKVDLEGTGVSHEEAMRRLRREYEKLGVSNDEMPEGMRKEQMPDGEKTYTKAEIDKMVADAAAEALAKGKAEGRAEAEKSTAETVAKALEDGKTRIAALEKRDRIRGYREHVVSKGWPGDPDKNATLVEEMHAALPEATFKAWIADNDATAAQIAASGIFAEFGSASESDGSATDRLLKKVGEVRTEVRKAGEKEPGELFERIASVYEENPDLYAQARDEHMTKVRLAGLRGMMPTAR